MCQEAKQSRIKFSMSRYRANRSLQNIRVDLCCGPVDPCTWDKNKYFLTFLYNYTHFVKVFLIKKYKDEVPDKIKEYIEKAEAHSNSRVSKLRCGNGRQYINKKVTKWCKTKSIEIDNTVTYTP